MGTLGAAVRDFFGWPAPGRMRRGSAGCDAADAGCYEELLSECGRLRERAHRAAVELDDSPRSLVDLNRLLALWHANPGSPSWLSIEAGSYLGSVMTGNLPGARWQLGPGAHPVVRLNSGQLLDVLAIATTAGHPGTTLACACAYAQACASPHRRSTHHT